MVGVNDEALFKYDGDEQKKIRDVKPWERDVNYFKEVKISTIALFKMLTHTQGGGNIEVMGLLQGKVQDNALVVMDCFALPVEGTETRVNAQAQAYEYMTNYTEGCEAVNRPEKVIGWYHSHPGYGCWLSGIDVGTQSLNQQYQEPFVAIVVDPIRTLSSGKVDLGAFRTYPKGYKPPDEPSEYQSIPQEKIEDFGVHCKEYYPLEVSYFKSSLDSALLDCLTKASWPSILADNPIVSNASYTNAQISDLGEKLQHAGKSHFFYDRIAKAAKDGARLGCEAFHNLTQQRIKQSLLNGTDEENLAVMEQVQSLVKRIEAARATANEREMEVASTATVAGSVASDSTSQQGADNNMETE